MNTYENHAEWIESIGPDVTVGQAERRIGLSKAVLRRQMERNNGRISPEYVIRIAIEYKLNPGAGSRGYGVVARRCVELHAHPGGEAQAANRVTE